MLYSQHLDRCIHQPSSYFVTFLDFELNSIYWSKFFLFCFTCLGKISLLCLFSVFINKPEYVTFQYDQTQGLNPQPSENLFLTNALIMIISHQKTLTKRILTLRCSVRTSVCLFLSFFFFKTVSLISYVTFLRKIILFMMSKK